MYSECCGERCQLVSWSAEDLGHDRVHFKESTEDEVLRPIRVVLGEREQVLGPVEIVVLMPLPVSAHVQPVLRIVSEEKVPSLRASYTRTHVELDLGQARFRHRNEVCESDQCGS